MRLLLLPLGGPGAVGRDAAAALGRLRALGAALLPRHGRGRLRWRRLLDRRHRLRVVCAYLAIAAGIVAAWPLAAQTNIDPGLFAAPDLETRNLLSFIGDLAGGADAALGRMLFVFNAGILVLGGFLLLWEILTATVDTASAGRWQFGGWHVVRIVAAVALMAPLAAGLNGAQHVVLGLANLGGDFATAVWRPFAGEVLESGTPVVPRPHASRYRAAIGRVLVLETCAHVANAVAAQAGSAPYVQTREQRSQTFDRWGSGALEGGGPAPVEGVHESEVRVGYDGAVGSLPHGLCGSIRYAGLGALGAAGLAAAAHRDALEAVRPDLRALAAEIGDRFVPGSPTFGTALPDVAAELDARDVLPRYEAAITAGMAQAAQRHGEDVERVVAEEAARIGWLGASTFFHSIAWQAGHFARAARGVAEVSLPLPELEGHVKQADEAVKALLVALGESGRYRAGLLSGAIDASGAPLAAGAGIEQMLGGLFAWIGFDATIVTDSASPLSDLAEMGHQLVGWALTGITLLATAATGSGLLESVPLFGAGLDVFESSWQVFDSFVSLALGLMLVAGAVLAYLLPLTPFVRFLFGILSWLINIVEALLSVTVWLAAHMLRDDPGRLTTAATRQGWLFLPGLILRPPLMLFGLLLGHAVFVAVMGLLNEVWAPALAGARASGGTGPIGYLAYLAIYVMVAYAVAVACFRLIDLLPDRVVGWIGGQSQPGSDAADRVAGSGAHGAGRLEGARISRLMRPRTPLPPIPTPRP